MLYNTIEYFGFFCIVLGIYYLIPKKIQWVYLLLVSYIFYYTFDVKYTFLLFASTIVTYASAIWIAKSKTLFSKKFSAIVCVVINLCILSFFKYSQWIVKSIFNIQTASLNFVIPVGISFYTFKSISYIVDVYRGRIDVQRNFGKYALFVSFFPQIVSGPIERSYNFFPQLNKGYLFDYEKVKKGFFLFLCGMVKKIVIADRLTVLVEQVFNNVYDYNAPAYIIAILFFTFQIYFDFSGYSDMAIGCTEMLGMNSIRNFNRPYFAASIGEFWRRWHISLSTWFRDYLYIPLGGNRISEIRWAFNILVVFLLSGLWHGASWNFVIWGGLHAIYQIIGKFSQRLRYRLPLNRNSKLVKVISVTITFILVAYAWMYFRANTIGDALHITKSLICYGDLEFDILNLGMPKQELIFAFLCLISYFILEWIQSKAALWELLQKQKLPIRWIAYLMIMFICIMFGKYGDLSTASFVYFQF